MYAQDEPRALSCRNPAYARNLEHFQYPSVKQDELQGQTDSSNSQHMQAAMQQSSSDSCHAQGHNQIYTLYNEYLF
jgi:hypothetical protein